MIRVVIFIISVLVCWSIQAQSSLVERADSLYATGNYSKAIEVYAKVDNQNLVYEKMAKSYVALGNYDQALSAYDQALEASPQDALIKYEYAKLLSKNKKLKTAATLLNELVYQDYKNPNYHYELGLVLEKQDDSTAMNRFHSAYELDPTHQKAIQKIAKQYLIHRNYKASLKYIETGLESYANNVELISLKALNYYWMENYKEAAVWFEKLLALHENSLFIHEKLSFCLAQEKRFEKAIAHAKISVSMDPKNATNLYILGQLYDEIGDYASAEDYLNKALVILDKPLNAEYTKLATVLNQQQKYKEALMALQAAIRENPDDETAHFFLARTKDAYYADENSKIKAYEVFIEKFPKSVYLYYVNRRLKELKEHKFMAEK